VVQIEGPELRGGYRSSRTRGEGGGSDKGVARRRWQKIPGEEGRNVSNWGAAVLHVPWRGMKLGVGGGGGDVMRVRGGGGKIGSHGEVQPRKRNCELMKLLRDDREKDNNRLQ